MTKYVQRETRESERGACLQFRIDLKRTFKHWFRRLLEHFVGMELPELLGTILTASVQEDFLSSCETSEIVSDLEETEEEGEAYRDDLRETQ